MAERRKCPECGVSVNVENLPSQFVNLHPRSKLDPWIGSRSGMLLVLLAVIGAGFAIYPSYLEMFVIRVICPLCVASFGVDLAILAVAVLWLR